MFEKYEEGTEDVSDELLKSHHIGTVIDEDTSTMNWNWIIGSLFVVIFMLGASWIYLNFSKTPEQLLKEQLSKSTGLKNLNRQVRNVLAEPRPALSEIKWAIEIGLDITQTNLRSAPSSSAPFIGEKYEAILEVLGGLLRLDIEGFIDLENSKDKDYLNNTLLQLGGTTLEFYEQGVQKQVPLLKTVQIREEIREINRNKKYLNSFEQTHLKTLHDELQKQENNESFTVVPAALILGKWYRYQNEIEMAKKCFKIGMGYVEGYKRGDHSFQGHFPFYINSLWEEYAACLEGLAEISFEEGLYREARSYLMRIFHAPEKKGLYLGLSDSDEIKEIGKKILFLTKDIKTLKRAIQRPEHLSSFPLISFDDPLINWAAMTSTLEKAANMDQNSSVIREIWYALSPRVQSAILVNSTSISSDWNIRKEIIMDFNRLIRDPLFYKKNKVPDEKLNITALKLLEKSKIEELNYDEYAFINRNIIDISFSETFSEDFILSDGQRLSNNLHPDSAKRLVNLYQEELDTKESSDERKQELMFLMEQIYNNELIPRYYHLQSQLSLHKSYLLRKKESYERVFDQLRKETILQEKYLQELSSADEINFNEIANIKRVQELAFNRQKQAKIQKEEVEKQLGKVNQELSMISSELYTELDEIELELAYLQERQNLIRRRQSDKQHPFLEILDNKITLHEKLMGLLENLRAANGNIKLQNLFEEKKILEAQEAFLKTELAVTSGDKSEELMLKLAKIESKRHQVITEFDKMFIPLRDVIKGLAEQEKKIWEAKTALKTIDEKITDLLGTEEEVGVLEEKSKQRIKLLLTSEKNLYNEKSLDYEIHTLNEAIISDQTQLGILLKQRARYVQTLATFYPNEMQKMEVFGSKHVFPLVEHLDEQKKLYESYSSLRSLKYLHNDFLLGQKTIAHDLQKISSILKDKEPLSERDVVSLKRYLQSIVKTENQLRTDRRLMKKTELSGSVDNLVGRGVLLDTTRWYELQHQMGIDLEKYNKIFDERDEVIEGLEKVLADKNEIEKERHSALKSHDELKAEILFPKIADLEFLIRRFSERLIISNQKLIDLGDGYLKKYEQVQNYRKSLGPKLTQADREIGRVQKLLVDNDKKLNSLTKNIFGIAHAIKESIISLGIHDLDSIDFLVESQKKEIKRLKEYRGLKHKENYYKAKSLWLYGKTFFEQSKLKSHSELKKASSISPEMLKDEKRFSSPIFDEFQEEFIYGDALLKGSPKKDDNNAAYFSWVDFLERNALRIFKREISKYSLEKYSLDKYEGFIPTPYQIDVNAFIARSKFFSGEIYLKRGLRFQDQGQSYSKFIVKDELEEAHSSFADFLNYVRAFKGGGRKAFLTEKEFSSKEFVVRKRKALPFTEEAKLYLGLIYSLQNQHTQAIEVFKNTLKDIITNSGIEEREEFFKDKDSYYASLLTADSISHEVIFRLARSYQVLAQNSYEDYSKKKHAQKNFGEVSDSQTYEELAAKAIENYSLLITTQSYSPWRKAALFQRGLLWKLLNNNEQAREDLVEVSVSSLKELPSFPWEELSLKGDLQQELHPSYSYVSFELGKLYFDMGDYSLATQSFLEAKEHSEDKQEFIKAKVAYAQALVKDQRWVKAALLLEELARESEVAQQTQEGYYIPEIWMDLARVKYHLGKFEESLSSYRQVFNFAPQSLVNKGDLLLDNSRGMRMLEFDFRDSIRPLAITCYEMADIFLLQKDFTNARNYYRKAQNLFNILTWKQDRLLKEKTKDEFDVFKKENIMKTSWATLKTDVLEFQYAQSSHFRKNMIQKTGSLDPNQLIEELDGFLKGVAFSQDQSRFLLSQLQNFKEEERKKLPEKALEQQILSLRAKDKELGVQQWQSFEALNHCLEMIESKIDLSGSELIKNLLEIFNRGSLEVHLLNEFAFEYLPYLRLTELDRQQMLASKGNFENLLFLSNLDQRVDQFPQDLKQWVERKIAKTGLSELSIPVSFESSLLEDVDLYIASLLSSLDTQQDHQQLVQLAHYYLESGQKEFSRLTKPSVLWQILEMAVFNCESREQWGLVQMWASYLLNQTEHQFFVFEDLSDKKRLQLSLAKSYLNLAKEAKQQIPFMQEDLAEVQMLQVTELKEKAYALLEKLRSLPNDSGVNAMMRIRAKQLSQQYSLL
jgi:tetratricopeptide (TPR) repeat protein